MAHSTETEIRPSAGAPHLPRGHLWWRDGRSICSCGTNQHFVWLDRRSSFCHKELGNLPKWALGLAVHEILAVFGRLIRLVAREQLGLLSLGVNLEEILVNLVKLQ